MNYIFVDIDGPLLASKSLYTPRNRLEFRQEGGLETHFDEFSVWAHNIWAKYGDAKIIFSTNWILHKTKDELKEICKSNGLDFEGRYYEEYLATKKKFTSERGSEVWWTIEDIVGEGDKFLIVDDDGTCVYVNEYVKQAVEGNNNYCRWDKMDNPPEVKWIKVDSVEGLSLKNFKDGCKFFGFDDYQEDGYTINDHINYDEFGRKMKTEEEKEEERKVMDMLLRRMI